VEKKDRVKEYHEKTQLARKQIAEKAALKRKTKEEEEARLIAQGIEPKKSDRKVERRPTATTAT
jgi:hypothetical protein